MGEFYALSCALVWAFAVILLQRSMERVGALGLNLFRNSVSVPLLVLTALIGGTPLLRHAPAGDVLLLLASGVIGIALADTLFHVSLHLIGAGISAIVSTLYSPLVILLTFLFLGEHLRAVQIAGIVLIAGGVLLSGNLHPPAHRTRRQLALGIGLGALDMVLLVVSVVIAKPVLDRSPVLWASLIRQLGAFAVILVLALASAQRARHFSVYRPTANWRFMIPGSALGSYLALVLWIAGLKYSLASLAAILTQTSTVWILILAVVFLREKMTARKALAAALAVAGVLLITLS